MPPSAIRVGLIALIGAHSLLSQPYAPGPQAAAFFSSIDDSDQPYALYIPKDYNPSRAWPLVVSLHGAYSNHRLNLRRVFGQSNIMGETDLQATRYFPKVRDVEYIVLSPLARGTMGYQGIPEKDVWDAIADVRKRFKIDEDRIYLTGLSMGGGGTFWLGLTRPDFWAAIAPVCPSIPNGVDQLANNALNLPVHLFHGDADPVVPVTVSRHWLKKLVDSGAKAEYTEYPGVRHNSWELAYKGGAIFDWFAKFKRNRFPKRVRFSSDRYEYGSAYWVRFDSMRPGTMASVDATFTARNRIQIKTERLDGFSLLVDSHPDYSAAQTLELVVDGRTVKARPKTTLAFSRGPAGWKQGAAAHVAGAKKIGMEGPISAAMSAPQVYIYGAEGRETALKAAEWSTPQLHLTLNFRAIADKAVKPADIAGANLVLLGTKETNSLLAKLAPRLPLELNAGAADYGLMFVYPVDGRYVVVNSGLPWWSGAENTKRYALRYLTPKNQVLLSFGDFVLFKGSLENVVVEGRFDRNWKLDPETAERMTASGAVTVR